MEISKTSPILVTGANGYVASWLVKLLLEEGWHVHGTVRNPDDDKKVGHLKKIAANSPGKLTLFKADLLKDGDFHAAMQGCELVYHTASPFIARGLKDPVKELIEPALSGTRNVLNSVNRTPSVKRVVLTTSVVAIYGDAVDILQIPSGRFDESHWNFSSSETHQPYNYSKKVAEEAAWEMVKKQNRWDLVAINPGIILGAPLTSASQSESLAMLKDIGSGLMIFGAANLEWGVVDVRDVAKGHRQAGLLPQAKGRHILVSDSITFLGMANVLRKHFGENYFFPRFNAPKFALWLVSPILGLDRKFIKNNVGYPLKFDNSYAKKDLQMEFRPVAQTIIEHFQQMLEQGVVKKII